MIHTKERFFDLERKRQRQLMMEIKIHINDMIDYLNSRQPTTRNAGIVESLAVRVRAASKTFRSGS